MLPKSYFLVTPRNVVILFLLNWHVFQFLANMTDVTLFMFAHDTVNSLKENSQITMAVLTEPAVLIY